MTLAAEAAFSSIRRAPVLAKRDWLHARAAFCLILGTVPLSAGSGHSNPYTNTSRTCASARLDSLAARPQLCLPESSL
ncbi:MAG: hypothetical protein QOK23_1194 [Gammaproteobacteria bacterium]|jgi:hypothetical protein|nr:hypothetical protein [Gammaproteobacteria bacterium]